MVAEATAIPTIAQQAPEKIEKIEAPFKMPQLKRPVFKDQTFHITQYGAIGDGKTKNTEAFKKAIEACTSAGGGMVLVPEGKWFTGPIHLKSNVNLHFEEGAELHFSDDPQDYLPVVFTRWAGFELYNYSPLIYARDCENIAITGPGKLFGHGEAWWEWVGRQSKTCLSVYNEQVLKNIPVEQRRYGTEEAGLRPQFINPVNCRNVLFEGFSIAAPGPFWTFDITYCENVIVRKLHLETKGGPNTDGINFDSSKDALVEYCQINVGDDCVALKSGINEDAWRVGKPTENIVIRHIKGFDSHGGIVIGSEMSGGVRNIYAHDCEFDGADRGIRLKSNASRGGVVENIWYENITMKNIKEEAIRINTNYGAWIASKDGKAYPVFRNITIRNVSCDGAKVGLSVNGTNHKPIENITMENVSIKSTTGMSFNWVNGLKLVNVTSTAESGDPISFNNCEAVVQSSATSTEANTAKVATAEVKPQRTHAMTLSEAANLWDRAMPTGNGQVGAMAFGNITNETVILTHDALFIQSEKPVLPNVSEQVPKVRQLLATGQYDEAQLFFNNEVAKNYDYRGPDSFHPAFNIMVDMETTGDISDQRRIVNFETGEVTVTWTQAGVDYERRLFVSRKDDAVVMRIRASKPGALNGRVGLLPLGLERSELGDGRNIRVPRFPSSPSSAKIKLKEVPITFNLTAADARLTLLAEYDVGGSYHMVGGEYGGYTRVIVKGGTKATTNLQVTAAGADEVLVLCKLFANEKGGPAIRRTERDIEILPADYDALLERHTALHRKLFLGAGVDLNADQTFREMTNEELINEVKQGKGLNAMMERLFDLGRYVLICSSRPGSMPANLQGIWNGLYAPAWASDYHNDINIQMAYFQALAGNMAEITLPYFDFYESMVDDFRTNARNIYSCRGIMAPISHTTHGLMYKEAWIHWTAGAGWLAQLFYDYWLYTGDRDFLAQRALPFMKEVALFYEDFLFVGKDGKYIFSPSYSPENSPKNHQRKTNYTVNSTMDIAVARELLGNLCTTCELLGVERDGVKRWRTILSKLPDYMINEDGAMQEWLHPDFKDQYDHRHMSHLYPLFPGFEITPENSPELIRACQIALEQRLLTPGTAPAWTFPLIACTYARLEDAAGATRSLEKIVPDYIWPNLFALHEKQRPIMQFEANSGVTAAVIEMLVFSSPEMIKLLPALPESWPVGSAEGIQTRAGMEVSLQWNMKHKRMEAEFLSRTDQQLTIKFPLPVVSIQIDSDNASLEVSSLGDAYRLLTLPAGKKIHLQAYFNNRKE